MPHHTHPTHPAPQVPHARMNHPRRTTTATAGRRTTPPGSFYAHRRPRLDDRPDLGRRRHRRRGPTAVPWWLRALHRPAVRGRHRPRRRRHLARSPTNGSGSAKPPTAGGSCPPARSPSASPSTSSATRRALPGRRLRRPRRLRLQHLAGAQLPPAAATRYGPPGKLADTAPVYGLAQWRREPEVTRRASTLAVEHGYSLHESLTAGPRRSCAPKQRNAALASHIETHDPVPARGPGPGLDRRDHHTDVDAVAAR